jgi:hypothetical protein
MANEFDLDHQKRHQQSMNIGEEKIFVGVNVVKINNQTATLVENVIRKKERESR